MYVPQYGLTFGYSTLVLALREPLVITGCAQLQTIPSTSDTIGLMMKNFLRILTILTISPMPTGMGSWPVRRFLTRPEPAFFDELAMSISCAANYMPKLEYMDLEFNATHQGRAYGEKTFLSGSGSSYGGPSDFHHYQGWSFYYRASNSARFASEYPKMCWFQH
jgi:hypothetical protein